MLVPGFPRADDPVTPEPLARSRIERACPWLAPVSLVPLGRGWDHDVWLANDTTVVRFPRNDFARWSLDAEMLWLPWLASRLPLAVPLVVVVEVEESGLAVPFAHHPMIPGKTLADCAAPVEMLPERARSLGAFVRALHSVDLADGPRSLDGDRIGRLDVAGRTPSTLEQLATMEAQRVLAPNVARSLASGLRAAQPLSESAPRVVAHGDLHPGNILADERGRLTGVIDWVDLHANGRAVDLATAYETFPASARGEFFHAYGDVDAETLALARWRGIDHSVRAYFGALERSDAGLARVVRAALIEMAA